jgi:hypothetical protein
MHVPRIDPQDRAFGAEAAKDQQFADEAEDMGAEEFLPERRDDPPRAGGKAEPDGESDTGSRQAHAAGS